MDDVIYIDYQQLVTACRKINDADLIDPMINIIAVKKEDLFDTFIMACKLFYDNNREVDLPKEANLLFNQVSATLSNGGKVSFDPVPVKGWKKGQKIDKNKRFKKIFKFSDIEIKKIKDGFGLPDEDLVRKLFKIETKENRTGMWLYYCWGYACVQHFLKSKRTLTVRYIRTLLLKRKVKVFGDEYEIIKKWSGLT